MTGGWSMFPRQWVSVPTAPESAARFSLVTYNILNDQFIQYVNCLQYSEQSTLKYKTSIYLVIHRKKNPCFKHLN